MIITITIFYRKYLNCFCNKYWLLYCLGFWLGSSCILAKIFIESLIPRTRILDAVNNVMFAEPSSSTTATSNSETTSTNATANNNNETTATATTAVTTVAPQTPTTMRDNYEVFSANYFTHVILKNLVARTIMSTIAVCAVSPFEFVYTRYINDAIRAPELRKYTSLIAVAQDAYQNEGFFSLFKGMFTVVVNSVIFHLVSQITFDALRESLSKSYHMQGHFVGTAFILGNVSAYPFMSIRRRMMVRKETEETKNRTFILE